MQKQTVIFEENPKWRIYKGKFFCQIRPLSRDRARILYLIILWSRLLNANSSRSDRAYRGMHLVMLLLFLFDLTRE